MPRGICNKAMCCVNGLDEAAAKKVDFYTRQYIDALSPSNFALTNPEVLQETVRSGGQNLLKGFNNLLDESGARRRRAIACKNG